MNHTIERHRRLYGLLRDTGTEEYKHELVFSYSHGRTVSSSDLTDLETDELIRYLVQLIKPKPEGNHATQSGVDYKGQQMRRRILSLCYTMGWSVWNEAKQKHDVDMMRLNNWMLQYSYAHKPMNDYSYGELQRLVVQFENMAKIVLGAKPTKKQPI